ncbi:MAG: hypothetical protein RR319_05390 [Bacteroides sp.]
MVEIKKENLVREAALKRQKTKETGKRIGKSKPSKANNQRNRRVK